MSFLLAQFNALGSMFLTGIALLKAKELGDFKVLLVKLLSFFFFSPLNGKELKLHFAAAVSLFYGIAGHYRYFALSFVLDTGNTGSCVCVLVHSSELCSMLGWRCLVAHSSWRTCCSQPFSCSSMG